MKYSAFTRYGHLRFSSKKPEAQVIYERMVAALGGESMVADGGDGIDAVLHARLYATAMRLATTKRLFDRVKGNENPATAVELLPYHERVYGLTPGATDTDDERRAALDIAQQAPLGCRPDVVLSTLSNLLGSNLIAVRNLHGATERHTEPTGWNGPSRPGTWKLPGVTVKRRTIDTTIHTLGSQTVSTTHVGGSDEMFVAGDVVVVEPGRPGCQEAVTVDAVSGDSFTGTFTRPHDANTETITTPWPTAWTTARHILIVTTSTVARSTEWRRRINQKLRKLMRGVDTWDIIEEYSSGVLGPFKVGEGLIGITPIEQINTIP